MSDCVPKATVDEGTKFVPLINNEFHPVFTCVGLMLVTLGVGFNNVTTALPGAGGFVEADALTVTVPCGSAAGGVYLPVVEIVPTVALPPAIPFTDQDAAAPLLPGHEAVKDCVLPIRTLGAGG